MIDDIGKIRILHISTSDSGGAGLAALRLHCGLRAQGYDSRMLVLCKNSSDPEVYRFEPSRKRVPPPLSWVWPYVELTARKLGVPLSRAEWYRRRLERLRQQKDFFFTLPFSDYDLTVHPLVQEADIIHLHWVADFLDYPSFFRKVNKPIVWTVRDENLYLGGWHYRRERSKHPHLDSFDDKLARIKRECVRRCKQITIVSLSRMMRDVSLSSLSYEIAAHRNHWVIPNPVDYSLFKPLNRDFSREVLGLPQDKRIVCFVSWDVWDTRKGLSELLAAVRKMGRSDIAVCAVGAGDKRKTEGIDIFFTGPISDQRLMALAYSAADLFVLPSFQEAFAKTPLEAMACGVPVVAFPCSGTEELINERNGIRVSDFTVEALAEGIQKALITRYDRDWIRNDVIERFGIEKIVSQYGDLYREVLKENGSAS